MSLNLAIEEAVTNIIRYGYPSNKESEIILRTSVAPGMLVTQIIDNGISFDPTAKETSDNVQSLDQQLTQGLGLFLILLIIFLLLRRRARKRRKAALEAQEAEQAEALAAAAAAVQVAAPEGADIMTMQTEKSMELRKEVRKFAEENPEIAAQMVKSWLKEGDEMG